MDSREQSNRTASPAGSSARYIFAFGPFRLDPAQRQLERNGSLVPLSARAFDILQRLIGQAGTVVSKNDLMATAWPDGHVDEASLRVHVAALRKALGDGHAGARYLSTVSGQGYCFVGSVSRLERAKPVLVKPALVQTLPALPRQMVGRAQAIDEITAKLKTQRFVTIVGPGGIGKTTVAVSVAHAVLEEFSGQVHFLSLGEIVDGTLVPAMVASALGLPARAEDPLGSLAAFLRDRRMLVVLDCCEHVIDTAAAIAERLHRDVPELHILATSRELLRVEGEHIHRLLPLAIPPENAALTAASALTYPAVELFIDRAITGGAEFEVTDANAADVGRLCRRLDGIPHAIELIAGHVGAYGAKAMVELLDTHFNLLWEGRRTALPRHRTLRATIEWSYNLLSEPERTVLNRLSVFAGRFTIEAARAIALAEAAGDETITATLDSLAAKSMLAVSPGSHPVRYRLLDTTRAYAQEKIAATADAEIVARRHASYLLDLLERLAVKREDLSAIADQFGNVRRALNWCFSDRGDRRTGVALAAASVPLFFKLSLLTECQHWASRAIAALDETGGNIRHDLALHTALGSSRMLTGQIDQLGVNCLNRALGLAEKIGEASGQLRLIGRLHLLQTLVGNFDDALRTAKRGEAIALASDDSVAVARTRVLLGVSHHYLGDVASARASLEAALLHPSLEDDVHSGLTLDYPRRAQITRARILWLQGYPDQATEAARRAMADVIAANHPIMFCRAMPWAFSVFFWNGDLEDCEDHVDRFVAECRRHGLATLQMVGECMKGIALLARGERGAGLTMLQAAVEKLRGQRFSAAAGMSVPLATALLEAGQGEEALITIDRAIAWARDCSVLMDVPDMLRVRAEVLARKRNPDVLQAERSFLQSLDLSRRQGALGYQLGAAISLARLWLQQARREEARAMLTPIHGRFTEGFNTHGLRTARELLAELTAPRSDSLAAN